MPLTPNDTSSSSALMCAGYRNGPMWNACFGFTCTSSVNSAGSSAPPMSSDQTGVRNRGDTELSVREPGSARSREYENTSRAAAAWIAVPQLKNANTTNARITSCTNSDDTFDEMM